MKAKIWLIGFFAGLLGAFVAIMIFWGIYSQKEIGNILGISQSLVSRIEKEALKKIKFLITYKNVSNMHTVKSKEYCK